MEEIKKAIWEFDSVKGKKESINFCLDVIEYFNELINCNSVSRKDIVALRSYANGELQESDIIEIRGAYLREAFNNKASRLAYPMYAATFYEPDEKSVHNCVLSAIADYEHSLANRELQLGEDLVLANRSDKWKEIEPILKKYL